MSNAKISNYSEIGKLNTVIVHKPGEEMENMTPETASEVLYDDILTLDLALKEHAQLTGVLNTVADSSLETDDRFVDAWRNAVCDLHWLSDFVHAYFPCIHLWYLGRKL